MRKDFLHKLSHKITNENQVIEETATTMDEIVNSANQLAVLAEQLNSEVQQFKL